MAEARGKVLLAVRYGVGVRASVVTGQAWAVALPLRGPSTPDGEISVHPPAGSGRCVLVLCDPDGGALYPGNMNGTHRRARYSNAGLLPDGLLRGALKELERRDDPVR